MAKKSIGILEAALRLEASQFRKELKTTGSGWGSFAKKWAGPAAAVTASIGAMTAAAAGLAKTFRFVVDEMGKIEEVGRLADRFGMAAGELQAIQLAADDSGVSVAALNTSFQRMSRKIGDAMRGIKESVALFDALGLDPQFLASRRPIEQLQLVAKAIRDVGNEQQQLSATVKMFDSEGAVLLSWFRDVNWEILQQQQLYKDLGITMDQDMYQRAKEINGELAMMEKAWAAFKRDIAVAIAGTKDLAGAGASLAFYLKAVSTALGDIVELLGQIAVYIPGAEAMVDLFDSLRGAGRQAQFESARGAQIQAELLRVQSGGQQDPEFMRKLAEQQREFAQQQQRRDEDRNRSLWSMTRLLGAQAGQRVARF